MTAAPQGDGAAKVISGGALGAALVKAATWLPAPGDECLRVCSPAIVSLYVLAWPPMMRGLGSLWLSVLFELRRQWLDRQIRQALERANQLRSEALSQEVQEALQKEITSLLFRRLKNATDLPGMWTRPTEALPDQDDRAAS